jgi:hypothetical protein
MSSYVTRAFVLMAVTLFLGGCGSRDTTREFTVDGHIFRIPTRHLLPNRVAWIPFLRSSGFNFSVDPEGEPGKKILVTVEPRKVTCRLDKAAASPMLRRACSAGDSQVPDGERGDRIEKVHFDGDQTQWTYVGTQGQSGSEKYPIAGCYMLDPKNHLGSCQSLGRYEDVVYSVSFNDADIGRLPEIRQRVEALLAAWEKQ